MVEGCDKFGRAANSAESCKGQMIAAGFKDVVEIQYKWPLNRWPKDKNYKEWGKPLRRSMLALDGELIC